MAIKYIDENISTFIEAVKSTNEPKVFIYFSDHGESVYTGRGHDSSRIQIDMLTVPLIIYINEGAKRLLNLNIDTQKMYKLDYIPYLISDIVGIDIGKYKNNGVVMIRNTTDGKTHINLKSINNRSWIFNQYVNSKNPKSKYSCLHRVNNLGKLNQGRLAFECLEFDVVVTESGNVYVDHDLPSDSNLEASFIINNTKKNNLSIWIDAKNIDTPANCYALSKIINENKNKNEREILVEFPSNSIDNLDELKECIEQLQNKVNYISYYVPTAELLSCQSGNESNCIALIKKLSYINRSKKFNSYSFDYRGVDFMISQKKLSSNMLYHSWGIKNISDTRLSHITMGIVNSSKMLNQN